MSNRDFTAVKFAVPPPRGRPWKDTDFVVMYGLYGSSGLNAYLVKRRMEKALPLLIAIHLRQGVLGKTRVPLTSGVWKMAGDPSKDTRVTMLAHLRRLPDLVMLREDWHPMFRYRVEKGPAWHAIKKAGKEGRGFEEDDEEEDI